MQGACRGIGLRGHALGPTRHSASASGKCQGALRKARCARRNRGEGRNPCRAGPRMRGPPTLRAGMNRTASTAPPIAPRQPRDVSVHGDPRNDDYFWLRDRDDPRTLAYLKAENAYADAWLAPHAELKETLYQEMLSRIQQDDDSVPMRKGDWWYSTQTRRGEQYPHYLRRRAVGPDRRYDPKRRRRDAARPERAGARPAVPPPGPHRRHARRETARLHDRPDRRARLHAPRQGPGDRSRSIRGRSRRFHRRRGRTTAAPSTT